MKYIKDRFYNPRKRSPSLGAPVHNLFTCEERTAFSCELWVQRYNKFLKPPNIRRSFFLRASSELETLLRNSKATEGRNPQSYLSYISPETVSDTSDQSDHRARSETPLFWVANAKVQQLFESTKYSEKFFFESLARASYTYYIGAPKHYSTYQNLLTTQGSPNTSEDPFFWVASAKVQRLFETTKFSANFFRQKLLLANTAYESKKANTL